MRVFIPQALRAYTEERACVDANGETLDAALLDLDRQYPGIRFRMIDEQDAMRPHIAFFVDGAKTFNLVEPLTSNSEVVIVQALSGG